jgi:hypothetical protein
MLPAASVSGLYFANPEAKVRYSSKSACSVSQVGTPRPRSVTPLRARVACLKLVPRGQGQ